MKGKSSIQSEFLDPRGPLFPRVVHEVPGLVVHERDLVVSSGPPERRVQWGGVDRAGRLTLVLFAEPHDEGLPAAVLAALGFGAEGRGAAARRWRDVDLRVDLAPCVVVVSPAFSTRTVRALAFLAPEAVVLLEIGQGTSLTRLDQAGRTGPTSYAAWPAAVRGALAALVRDVRGVDPEIEEQDLGGELRLVWRGEEIARVSGRDGRLVVSEDPTRAGALPVDEEARRVEWIESFLVAHCARRAAPAGAPRPLALLDRSAGPLLSPEELAAFRD